MKRSWISWFAILAMLTMLGAIAGCSDDDDDGGTKPPVDPYDETAALVAAGDDYFDDYQVEFPVGSGTLMGVNIKASTYFANYDDYYTIDLRGADDYNNLHVIGAHNVTLGTLVDEIENMPTDKIIVVMCYSGQTASFATSIINLIGTETGHVALNLKFGASGLMPLEDVFAHGNYTYPMLNEQHGLMVETASPAKHVAGDYPDIDTDATTALEALKNGAKAAIATWADESCRMSNTEAAAASADELYLINYFSESDYLDGHLPLSINYLPGDIVSAKELATLPTDMPIGVYCYTGQTSAQVVAYLQMLGYQARTVMYGVQKMAYDDQDPTGNREGINDVPWHAPEDYSAIFE